VSALLGHIPLKKTYYFLLKRKRNFHELALFAKYESRNAAVDFLHPYPEVYSNERH
jgi:hypothetical protein